MAVILGADFVHGFSDLSVGSTLFDDSLSGLHGMMSSQHNVSLAAFGATTVTNHLGEGSNTSETINVGTADNFGDITFLEGG